MLFPLPQQVEIEFHFGLWTDDSRLGPILLSCLLKRLSDLNDVVGQSNVGSFMERLVSVGADNLLSLEILCRHQNCRGDQILNILVQLVGICGCFMINQLFLVGAVLALSKLENVWI